MTEARCPRCGHINIQGADECEDCHSDLTAARTAPARGGSDCRLSARIREDRVSDLSPHPAVTARLDETVAQAARRMAERHVGCVLVSEPSGGTGIFTERDLLNRVLGPRRDPAAVKLREVYTSGIELVQPDDSLAHVLHCMSVGGYRHVAVADPDGAPRVISVRDILAHLTA